MIHWIKKNKVLMVCAALLFTPAALNYSGFCMSEGRWLSDEERINIEIQKIVGSKKEYIGHGPDGSRWYDVIPYASIDEFKQINPECCSIRHVSHFSTENIIPIFSGNDSGAVITINYTQRLLLHGGILNIASGPTEYNMRLQTNCGKLFYY